jgi:zinc protease
MTRNGSLFRTATATALAGVLAGCGAAAAGPGTAARQVGPPPPLPETPLEFPAFTDTRLPNGLQLIVVEHHGQPLVNLNLYVRAGSVRAPAERAGLAGLTAELVTKGTPTRTAGEIAELIERVGGSLGAFASTDNATVSTSVLTEHLPLAMDLLAEVALQPTFPESELELARRRTLSNLRASLGQPGAVAQRRFLAEIYGAHPYGVSSVPGTVEAITRTDVVGFHQAHFRPDNALLVVSGNVRAAQIEQMVRERFGAWTPGAAAAPALSPPPARDAARIYLVHRPGSVQSTIQVGHVGVRPGSPDFFALQVLNSIVGGTDDARLFQILREQRGWTYGAYSRLEQLADIGYFNATAEVRTEVTDSALVEMLHQLRRIRDESVTEQELRASQGFLAGSFPLRIETPGQIAGQVASTRLLGLPLEHLTQYRERIRAVTPADVQRVARQYVFPDRAAIVVVGDATRLLTQLRGIAPITLYDVEGQRLDPAALQPPEVATSWDASRLTAGTHVYDFLVQGNRIGSATVALRRDGDVWVQEERIESPMVQQESELRFGATDFRPISTRSTATQGPARMEVELAVEGGRLRGRAGLPPQMGGPRDVDRAAEPGMLLPGMEVLALMTADLAEGLSFGIPVYRAMDDAVSTLTARVAAREAVTVPAGTFPAYRVELEGPEPRTLWLRADAPHIVLRQSLAGGMVTIDLTETR